LLKGEKIRRRLNSRGSRNLARDGEAFREAAGGKDVEEFLAELIAERLDPPERVELYVSMRNF
jgi:hypothetical protein